MIIVSRVEADVNSACDMKGSPMTETYWNAVNARDKTYDGQFVYAVKTTGVYCRPSCPSRRPKPENVEFFATPAAAENADYRACQRCDPRGERGEAHHDLMVAVCRYLEHPHESIPTLDELAAKFALSPFHLQRVFKRIVGVSPHQYADAQRQARLKDRLKRGDSVTSAVYDAGYNSSSSFYQGVAITLGMKPVTYRKGGAHMTLHMAIAPCSLGYLLVAATERGICAIRLGDAPEVLTVELAREFPGATIDDADDDLHGYISTIVRYLDGDMVRAELPLDIRSTAFQRKVWDALRAIPYGERRTYAQVAESIGQPTAARAVAAACAANPVALAIPCHRVINSAGGLSGYRWGIERKRAILTQESDTAQTLAG